MTIDAAYLEDLPCRNKSCKSYGKPHPNCQCYAGGGDVLFCSEDRTHKKGCKYFADGGDTGPKFEDTESISADASSAPKFADTVPIEGSDAGPKFEDTEPAKPFDFKSMAESTFPTTDPSRPGADTRSPDEIKSDIQAIAEGIGGPLTNLGMEGLSKLGVPGMSFEEQEARKQAHPGRYEALKGMAGIASVIEGIGLPGMIAKGVKAIPFISSLKNLGSIGQAGASILENALGMGTYSAANATSKALLGEGDPEHPVAMIATEGLGGMLAGGAFGAATSVNPLRVAGLAYMGKKAYENFQKGDIERAIEDGLLGLGALALKKPTEKFMPSALIKTLKTLPSEDLPGAVPAVAGYVSRVAKGDSYLGRAIDGLMQAGKATAAQAILKIPELPIAKDIRNKADEWVAKGPNHVIDEILQKDNSEDPSRYAKGGLVKKDQQSDMAADYMGKIYPDQNAMLSAMKLRTANYLGSLRPATHSPKLAFDQEPDDTEKKKIYNRALDVAINPLSVLSHIKAGTITKEHVGHMTSMYPELKNVLQQRLTQKISEAQLQKERVPPHVRDGLSLFMGTPLSGESKPANIQAAQAVFHSQKAAAQNQPANGGAPAKNSKSSLSKMGQSLATSDQARTIRDQRET